MHFGFPIEKILTIFDTHVTSMLSTKFQGNWPFGSGEEAKIYFHGHGCHIGFPIETIFVIFDLQVNPCFLPSFKSIGLFVQEKQKVDFQDGRHIWDFRSEQF